MTEGPRTIARQRTIVVMTLALLLVGAPAAADPAGPTHFRSTITGIVVEDAPTGSPDPVADLELEILGGDAFLVVRAAPGTSVEVPGYEGEPYVRIAADGTVEVNTRSPARWLNDERFGLPEAELPAQADADAPPSWELVARNGEYAWHDHRIHWMSPTLPPSVDTTRDEPQQVSQWSVPLVVDDAQVTVEGELDWVPGPSPVVPAGALVLCVAAGVWLALRRESALTAAIATGAVLTGAVGVSASVGLPTGADAEPALVVLPGLAAAVLGAARWWAGRAPARARWLVPAAALPLVVWGIVQAGTLTRPIVPGPVPGQAVALITALVFGVGAAAATTLLRRVLAATALDPDAPEQHD
jgi:hypothetical protein